MSFRSLPYPDAERLVQVGRRLNEGPVYTMSYARFRFLEQNNRAFESLAAYDVVGSSLSITLGETPELLQSSRVSADFFRVLGVNPMLGLTSIVFGLAPALQSAKMEPAQTLRELGGATSKTIPDVKHGHLRS